jgi:hypothetical protein
MQARCQNFAGWQVDRFVAKVVNNQDVVVAVAENVFA